MTLKKIKPLDDRASRKTAKVKDLALESRNVAAKARVLKRAVYDPKAVNPA